MRWLHAAVAWCQIKVWGSYLGSSGKPTLSHCSGILVPAASMCPSWRARITTGLVSSLPAEGMIWCSSTHPQASLRQLPQGEYEEQRLPIIFQAEQHLCQSSCPVTCKQLTRNHQGHQGRTEQQFCCLWKWTSHNYVRICLTRHIFLTQTYLNWACLGSP